MKFTRRTGQEAGRAARGGVREQRRRPLGRLFVLAAAGLAALVPLVLFAGFWIRAELTKTQGEIESYLSTRANAFSRRIDAQMEQQLVALRAISALPTLDGDASNFKDMAERMVSSMPHWAALGLVEASTGEVLQSTRPDWPGAAGPAIAAKVRETRKPHIETGATRPADERNVLLYMPVVRDDQVRYVLVSAYDPRDLEDITVEQSQSSNLILSIEDGRGRTLARSRSPETSIGSEDSASFREAVANKFVGLVRSVDRNGEPISSAFTRSLLTGWIAVATIDRKRLDQLSTGSLAATVAAGVLSLVLAIILIVFIVHTVMERRVSDERLAASRALGELDARLLATTQEALGEQRKASSEREVLLREIYHRVKNNLQIVQSLLRLGSRDLSPEQREPFEGAVRRVGAMARVHTLLYNSPDLASIDFKDYLEELLKELSEGFAAEERSIESVLDAHSMRVPLDTAVPLAFIAVEILTNAYRHAFPEGRRGRISVEIRQESEGVLRIQDDGIGITSSNPAKRRLGLTIVRKLVQQIGGTLEEPPPGASTFVIRFPLEAAAEADTGAKTAPVT